MSARAIQRVGIVLTVVVLAGCQSGPRWAWWKKDTAPTETSVAARTAPPALPSSQATPESLTAAATPPSANSVPVVTPPPVSIPATSTGTIASAPSANYSASTATNAPAAEASGSAAPPAGPVAAAAPATAVPSSTAVAAASNAATSTTTAQAGPYDPNAYQPALPSLASSESFAASNDPDFNRYGEADANRGAAAAPPAALTAANSTGMPEASADRYAGAPSAATPFVPPAEASTTTPAQETDRYGNPAVGRYASIDRYAEAEPARSTGDAEASISASVAAPPVAPAATAPQQSIASSGTVSPSPSATVRLAAPPGQYRPGGTSTFTGLTANQLEIASRPSTSAPAATVPPPPPMTPSAPAYRTDGGVRTY